MKKILTFTYQFFMVMFSPITLGMVLPLGLMILLNVTFYNELPKSSDFDVYSNWVCNQGTLIMLIIGYILSWFGVKSFFEKRGIDIM